eukprot:scaffold1343_cov69-Phaeocystis_antarctica.AAC.1
MVRGAWCVVLGGATGRLAHLPRTGPLGDGLRHAPRERRDRAAQIATRAPRGATAGVRQSLSFRALSPARHLHAGGDMRALLGAGVDAQSESEKKRKKLQKASCYG